MADGHPVPQIGGGSSGGSINRNEAGTHAFHGAPNCSIHLTKIAFSKSDGH